MRLLPLVLILLLATPAASEPDVQRMIAEQDRAMMAGLRNLIIFTDMKPPVIEGLDKADMQARISKRLTQAGLRDITGTTTPGPFGILTVSIDLTDPTNRQASIDLKQPAYLQRNPKVTVMAETWSKSAEGRGSVLDKMDLMVERFVSDWVSANPRH